MAKHKNRQKSDRVSTSKVTSKPENPFEFHFNRSKRNILGHTVCGERGQPGISKAKSVQMRKRTLLKEMKNQHKSNEFIDRRFGRDRTELSLAERMSHRFTTERKRQSKKDIFNLDDTTELTHMGVSIDQLDRYEDPRSDDEDNATLSSDFVKHSHFGGGLLSKSTAAQASGKDWIHNMITDSLLRKKEAHKLREETLVLTEQLDSDYRSLASLMKTSKNRGGGARLSSDVSHQMEPVVNQSVPSSSATVEDCLARSHGNSAVDETARGFDVSSQQQSERLSRAISTGKSNAIPTENGKSTSSLADVGKSVSGEDDYDRLVKQLSLSRRVPSSVGVKSAEQSEKEEKERVRQLEESRQQRMCEDGGDSEEEMANNQPHSQHTSADLLKPKRRTKDKQPELSLIGDQLCANNSAEEDYAPETNDNREPKLDSVNDEKIAAALRWSSFSSAVSDLSPLQLLHFLQGLLEALGPEGGLRQRARLRRLYRNTLRHVFGPGAGPGAADLLLPLLYDMTRRLGGGASGAVWQHLLRARYSVFAKRRRGGFPAAHTLLMLRTAVLLFPPSDHRHPVTLPTILFLSHLLTRCQVTDLTQLARALFVVSLLVECTSLSCRLVPEALVCLQSLLFTACGESAASRPELAGLVTLPYTSSGQSSRLLRLENSCVQISADQWKLSLSDLSSGGDDGGDHFRLRATHVLFQLLSRLLHQYRELPAASELFTPAAKLAAALPKQLYPESIRCLISTFISSVERLSRGVRFTLARADRKPKPLPLYEPDFTDSTEGRGVDLSRGGKTGEHQRLLRCHRRQLRSTVRHVRRDAALVSRHTLDRRIRADKERKGKVKQLMALLGNQEGDFRKMERQKRKM